MKILCFKKGELKKMKLFVCQVVCQQRETVKMKPFVFQQRLTVKNEAICVNKGETVKKKKLFVFQLRETVKNETV